MVAIPKSRQISSRHVIDGDEFRFAQNMVNHRYRGDRLETQLSGEAHELDLEFIAGLGSQH